MQKLELKISVGDFVGMGEPAHVAVTVHLPDPQTLPETPVVCFAKPGGGYSRGYFTVDLPGPARGAQAEWHAKRGWIFVSVDHLGVGDSSLHDAAKLDFPELAAGGQAAEQEILKRLAEGTLAQGYPKIANPLKLGIGQSMGGSVTIVQQARYHCYDGVGILGYSVFHSPAVPAPGYPPIMGPWIPRDAEFNDHPVVMNEHQRERVQRQWVGKNEAEARGWSFHYDDVDRSIVDSDLAHFRRGIHSAAAQSGYTAPPWNSLTVPYAVARKCTTPAAVAQEAAAITEPVLLAFAERDVAAVPKLEPSVYQSARSVDLFVCPRMAHMHNFAGTRELFWRRIDQFAGWVGEVKAFGDLLT